MGDTGSALRQHTALYTSGGANKPFLWRRRAVVSMTARFADINSSRSSCKPRTKPTSSRRRKGCYRKRDTAPHRIIKLYWCTQAQCVATRAMLCPPLPHPAMLTAHAGPHSAPTRATGPPVGAREIDFPLPGKTPVWGRAAVVVPLEGCPAAPEKPPGCRETAGKRPGGSFSFARQRHLRREKTPLWGRGAVVVPHEGHSSAPQKAPGRCTVSGCLFCPGQVLHEGHSSAPQETPHRCKVSGPVFLCSRRHRKAAVAVRGSRGASCRTLISTHKSHEATRRSTSGRCRFSFARQRRIRRENAAVGARLFWCSIWPSISP